MIVLFFRKCFPIFEHLKAGIDDTSMLRVTLEQVAERHYAIDFPDGLKQTLESLYVYLAQ